MQGLRALVGGASRGLGRAISEALAAEEVAVALAARESDALHDAAKRVGGTAVPADLSTPEGPETAVTRTVEALGGLDLLVVNSGGPPGGDFGAVGDHAWETAVATTLMSTVRMIRCALPHLEQGCTPAIAIVLSSSVRSPIPGLVTSNVLRPGLAGLVKSLSVELAPEIRINGIAPGRIATDRVAMLDAARAEREQRSPGEVRAASQATIPLGRYGVPQELGAVAAFLLSPRASYVNGHVLNVDGGMAKALP
jgi:3-oxoacyl-[acyl-carrier protein] reductase